MLYNVGEVAKLLGVAPSTLRYYDREGLLPFVERTSGGFRMFSDKDLEWLAVIECLKQSGLTIKEIQSYISQCAQGDSTISQRKALFAKRRDVVLAQIRDLQKTLDMLDYKMWFYTVAEEAGTVAAIDNLDDSEIPPRMLEIRQNSRYNKIKQQAAALREAKAAKAARSAKSQVQDKASASKLGESESAPSAKSNSEQSA